MVDKAGTIPVHDEHHPPEFAGFSDLHACMVGDVFRKNERDGLRKSYRKVGI